MGAYSGSDLVAMVNSRDLRFFSEIHERFFKLLFVECRKRDVSAPDSEEIVNDIFNSLYTSSLARKFESGIEISRYLYKATKNKCINHLQKKRVAAKRAIAASRFMDDDHLDMLELQFREKIWASNAAKLKSILDTTSVRCLDILRMIYYEGKSVPEIAGLMGIAEQTVRNHKTKGLDMMARLLSHEDFLLHTLLIIIYTMSVIY